MQLKCLVELIPGQQLQLVVVQLLFNDNIHVVISLLDGRLDVAERLMIVNLVQLSVISSQLEMLVSNASWLVTAATTVGYPWDLLLVHLVIALADVLSLTPVVDKSKALSGIPFCFKNNLLDFGIIRA